MARGKLHHHRVLPAVGIFAYDGRVNLQQLTARSLLWQWGALLAFTVLAYVAGRVASFLVLAIAKSLARNTDTPSDGAFIE
ncbi:MAG: hypothetical protein ABIP39_05710, partial [Polyangiaceae bacterium]